MERATKRGRPQKGTDRKAGIKLNVYLTRPTWKRVCARAEQDGRSLSDWARRLIETAVGS